MKAIVYYDYGSADVLRYEEIEKPVPGDDQILVRVRAAALNPVDRHLLHGMSFVMRKMFGIAKPSVAEPGRIGRDVAGEVEAVGKDVTEFKPGDEVFGHSVGSCAEYVCGPTTKFVLKPENVTFEEAASAPVAAFTALQGLRDHGKIQAGQKVLVNGAGGGVGSYAVQIAKSFGAEVTGVCRTANVETVRSIGADHVIDYTLQDFTENGERYDLIFDCYWNHSLSASKRALKPNGSYLIVGGPVSKSPVRFLSRVAAARVVSLFAKRKFLLFMAKSNKEDMTITGELLASGKIKPVIVKRYSLKEVPEAIRYLDEGHTQGKIVITPE